MKNSPTHTPLLNGLLLIVLSCITPGCTPSSAPARAFDQFQKAVERKERDNIWNALSSQSQSRLQRELKARNSKMSAKDLITHSTLTPTRRLRRDPKKPHVIGPKRATLHLRNELEQPVQITMLLEHGKWRVLLGSHFANPSFHTRKTTTRKTTTPPNTLPTKTPSPQKLTP